MILHRIIENRKLKVDFSQSHFPAKMSQIKRLALCVINTHFFPAIKLA